jgi:hypothetical protein
MNQLLTIEFWNSVVATLTGAPINIPLIIVGGYVGWLLRKREDSGTISGLREHIKAFEERLKGRDDQLSGQIRELEERSGRVMTNSVLVMNALNSLMSVTMTWWINWLSLRRQA